MFQKFWRLWHFLTITWIFLWNTSTLRSVLWERAKCFAEFFGFLFLDKKIAVASCFVLLFSIHTLVDDACIFRSILVAHTSYKTLQNASKFLHVLQNYCSMEVCRKLFDARCKKYAFSMQHIKLFASFCNYFQQTIFLKVQTFSWF